jgi:L-fuculose-phosphate aldolase
MEAGAVKILRGHGLEMEAGAVSVSVSGEPASFFDALQDCAEEAANQGYVISVTIVPQGCPTTRPDGKRDKETVTYRAIGRVESIIDEPAAPEVVRSVESRIVVDPAVSEGLEGITPGGRILVVFWFDRSEGYELRIHPRGDASRGERGVFATHSPFRPNPIGVTEVRVLAVEGNMLFVRGLDALNGTPVLDIKSA